MDSLTHIAIGACMGEVFVGRKLGKRAMLWGALAQSAPDIDFLASLWLNPSANLLAHRGFTHSFLFCLFLTPLMALAAAYLHRPHDIKLTRWILFFGSVIFTHVLMDAFNNYGVGWFEPFNHSRVTFNAIYVADPFFSLWPGLACLLLILTQQANRLRKVYGTVGLGMATTYLIYCLINKSIIDHDVKLALKSQSLTYSRYFTTPAPLQNWLWYIVAGNDSGYYVGFRSIFDHSDTITFEYFPTNESLLYPLSNLEDVERLKRFSQEFYTVERWGDTLVFNDLRFGQIVGWNAPRGKFVFHYYLTHNPDNSLVVQRGRFDGWNRSSMTGLWRRLIGRP